MLLNHMSEPELGFHPGVFTKDQSNLDKEGEVQASTSTLLAVKEKSPLSFIARQGTSSLRHLFLPEGNA